MEVDNVIEVKPSVSRHRCDLCDKTFADSGKLNRHMKEVHTEGTRLARCHLCPKAFKRPETLKVHIKGFHEHDEDIWCDICKRSFMTIQARTLHRENVHGGMMRYPCTLCDMKFKWDKSLQAHLEKVHGGGNMCHDCGKNFYSKYHKDRHLEHVHSLQPDGKTPIDHAERIAKDNLAKSGDNNSFKCKTCLETFPDPTHLHRHIGLRHKRVFDEAVCEQCGVWFVSQESLASHVQFAHEEHKFMCNVCGSCFASQKSLNYHMRKYHGVKSQGPAKKPYTQAEEEMMYECKKCGKRKKKRHDLILHIAGAHMQEGKTFDCKWCDKKFPWNTSLERHVMSLHKEHYDLDFVKGLRQAYNQEMKARAGKCEEFVIERNIPKTDKIQCKACPRSYETQEMVDSHFRRAHTPYKKHNCPAEGCKSAFKRFSTLKIHAKGIHGLSLTELLEDPEEGIIVDGEEASLAANFSELKFECKECGKRSSSKFHLLKHAAMCHINEEDMVSFQCKWCPPDSKSYKWYEQFLSHKRKEHPEEPDDQEWMSEMKEATLQEWHRRANMVEHLLIDHRDGTDELDCPACEKTFSTKKNLDSHFARVHIVKPSECPECFKVFGNPSKLTDHIRVHRKSNGSANKGAKRPLVKRKTNQKKRKRKEEWETESEMSDSDPSWRGDSGGEEDNDFLDTLNGADDDSDFDIGMVDPDFKLEEGNLSIKVEMPDECLDFSNLPDVKPPVTLTLIKKEKPKPRSKKRRRWVKDEFVCWTCGKQFRRINCTARRITTTCEMAVVCLDCDGCFGPSGLLKNHVEKVRLLRSFICADCGLMYESQRKLDNHVSLIHYEHDSKQSEQSEEESDPMDKIKTVIWNRGLIATVSYPSPVNDSIEEEPKLETALNDPKEETTEQPVTVANHVIKPQLFANANTVEQIPQ